MKYEKTRKQKKSRNILLTILSGFVTLLFGFGAYVCWTNLHHDPLMWISAILLSFGSLVFLGATITGRAEDFFLALIGWW